MRFTYAEAMTDPKYYIPLAKAADEAGYHAMTIPDSIACAVAELEGRGSAIVCGS